MNVNGRVNEIQRKLIDYVFGHLTTFLPEDDNHQLFQGNNVNFWRMEWNSLQYQSDHLLRHSSTMDLTNYDSMSNIFWCEGGCTPWGAGTSCLTFDLRMWWRRATTRGFSVDFTSLVIWKCDDCDHRSMADPLISEFISGLPDRRSRVGPLCKQKVSFHGP
jgi:hypothetical protein